MSQAFNERRFKTIEFPIEFIAAIGRVLQSGVSWRTKTGVPEDAEYVRCWLDSARECLVVIYAHASFPRTCAGEPPIRLPFDAGVKS